MQDFEELYEQYDRLVFKYVMGLCRDSLLAEEITQETFFKALRGIKAFKGNCSLGSWLCGIAKNVYYSQCRRRQSLPLSEVLELRDDMEAKLLDRETARAIHRALHALREPYKEVFWLKTFAELSFREIEELFDKSESWGRVTYYRAKIMIREEMR